MTDSSLLHELMTVINEHSTWIIAVDDCLFRVVYISEPYGMIPYSCKNLVLKTTVRSQSCRCGHEWYLPDYRLQQSKQRIAPGKTSSMLDMKDVEAIVLDASDGQIALNLKD